MTNQRAEEDPLVAEVPTLFRRLPLYRYEFIDRTHSLRFQGLFRYVQLTHDDIESELYRLQFKQEKATPEEVKIAVEQFIGNFNLPCEQETKTVFRYNWLIAVHARNNSYKDEISRAVLRNPRLLNYHPQERPFSEIFMQFKKNIVIDCYDGNIFNSARQYQIEFIRDNTIEGVKEALLNRKYSLTHVSWNLHKHIFIYETEQGFINKILDSILSDMTLYHQQKASKIDSRPRPSERMVTYCDVDHAKRLLAIAPFYLEHLYEVKPHRESLFTMLKTFADELYDDPTVEVSDDERLMYLYAYDHPWVALLLSEQYVNYSAEYWPYVVLLTATYQGFAISSRQRKPVLWTTAIETHFDKLDEEPATFMAIPTSNIPLMDSVNYYTNVDSMFKFVSYGPNISVPSIGSTSKAAAIQRYSRNDSHAQTYMNNLGFDMHSLYERGSSLITKILASEIRVSKYSLNHLVLCMMVERGIISLSSVTLDTNFKRRARLNSSLVKMISNYIYAFERIHKTEAESGVYAINGFSVSFLGAETEPAMDVLKLFYGTYNLRVSGYGNRAIGLDKERVMFEDLGLTKLKCDVIISDINQTDFEIVNAAEYDKTLKLLTDITVTATLASKVAMIKINLPSNYLLNVLALAVYRIQPSLRIRLIRFAAQKPFTYECFLTVENANATSYVGFLDNPITRIYQEQFSLDAKRPYVTHTLDNIIRDESPTIIRAVAKMDYAEGLFTVATYLSMICGHIITRASDPDVSFERSLVYFTAKPSEKRKAITMRLKFDDGENTYIDEDGNTRCAFAFEIPHFLASVPNGFGQIGPKDHDVCFKIRGVNGLMKNLVYKRIKNQIPQSAGERFTSILMIGGRDLDELVAVSHLYKVPIICWDPSKPDYEYTNLQITQKSSMYEFSSVIPNNTLVLCLYTIMNQVDGTPVSATEQVNKINQLFDAANASSGTSVFLQCYWNEGAKHLLEMSENDHFYVTKNTSESESVYSVSVSDYTATPMIDVAAINKIVRDRNNVTVLPLHYQAVLETTMNSLGVLSETGAMLLGLTLASTCLLQLDGTQ
uniref:Turret n=1 Tax=Elemess virus TaxID=2800913 RepID=A0A894KKT1_9VIRU|nr:MAG: turret [Elemess virus]